MASEATARSGAADSEFTEELFKGGELLAAGKVIEAKDHLERAYQLQPDDEKALNLLGLSYFKLGLFERAAEIYENLVRDNPADPTLRVNLGLVYLKSNALNRAIRELEIAADLAPEHPKAHNYLGLALAQAGEFGKAREHFLQAGSDAMAEKMARALEEANAPAPPTVSEHRPAEQAASSQAGVEIEESEPEELAIDVEEPPPAEAPRPGLAAEPRAPEPAPRPLAAPTSASVNGAAGGAVLFEQDWGAQFSDAPEEASSESLDVPLETADESLDVPLEPENESVDVPLEAVGQPVEELSLEAGDQPVEELPLEAGGQLVDDLPLEVEELPAIEAEAPAPQGFEAPPVEGPALEASAAVVDAESVAAFPSLEPRASPEPPSPSPFRMMAKPARTEPHALAPELRLPESADAFEVQPEGAVVRVHDEVLVRGEGLMAALGSLEFIPEFQRHHGRPTEKPFGEGESRLLRAKGQGQILFARGPHWFEVLDLADDSVYLREDRLFGFEEPIAYENGQIPAEQVTLNLVHLRGEGKVLLKLPGELRTVPVRDPLPVVIPLVWWVGWNGSVLPRVIQVGGEGPQGQLAVELSGEGFALIAVATPEGRIG